MDEKKLLAQMYDFYNAHTLRGQNGDIAYYLEQLKKYRAKLTLVIGAGTGRVAIPLTEVSKVTALDFDKERLDILKQKTNKVETIYEDFYNYNSDKNYDSMIVPYSTIQFVSEGKNFDTFLRKLYEVTNLNTTVIFDASESFNSKKEKQNELLFQDYCKEVDDNVAVYYTCKRWKEFAEFLVEYRLCQKQISVFENEKYRYYNQEELMDAINDNNFDLLKIDDGYGNNDFQHKHLYHLRRKK